MSSTKKILIKNGTIVTMDSKRRIITGDVLVENGLIKAVHKSISPRGDEQVVDAKLKFVIPGLIQVHTHLCQVLFRGYADDLNLLDWLKTRIWPLEKAHNAKSLRASADLGLLEMQLLGTTSILDMGTVSHTGDMFESVKQSKMRYWGGKCLMDRKSSSGPLYEETKTSLKEMDTLIEKYHQSTDRLNYAICPRFAISCTEKILKESADRQKSLGLLVHTHASESKEEVAIVKKRTGKDNVEYFDHLGLLNSKTVIVHGVHLTKKEVRRMVVTKTPLVHCPSSNLKLASGIAPIHAYDKAGLKIGLGSDGAPCSNTMDPFMEMRLAALLQKPIFGPEALPAQKALELATIGGARVLNMEDKLGSLEENKLADIVIVDRSHPSVYTVENPYSALVYSCSGRDVSDVMIGGEWIVRNKKSEIFDENEVLRTAEKERKELFLRAKIKA